MLTIRYREMDFCALRLLHMIYLLKHSPKQIIPINPNHGSAACDQDGDSRCHRRPRRQHLGTERRLQRHPRRGEEGARQLGQRKRHGHERGHLQWTQVSEIANLTYTLVYTVARMCTHSLW